MARHQIAKAFGASNVNEQDLIHSMASDNGNALIPVSQWAYPFAQKTVTEVVNPDAYLAAFSASDGAFPLGLNGLWHGGIHLDEAGPSPTETDDMTDRSRGVRCVADGVVVAYRLDTDYQHLSYPDNTTALYSRSFTLVKHKLRLPVLPTNSSGAPTTTGNTQSSQASEDPADSLIFFSLYMHLAPCTVYRHLESDNSKKNWPDYYNVETIYTVNPKATPDEQVHVGNAVPIQGAHVHRDSNNHVGASIAILPSGSKVKIQRPAHAPKNWARVTEIVSGELAPLEPGHAVPSEASHGWVFLPWLDGEINPAALDRIYVLPKPIRIAAGEVVGYLGEYQNATHTSTLPPNPQRALLHVEIFAGDELPAFLARSRARSTQLTQEEKTQLVLAKGANLYGYLSGGELTLPAHTAVTSEPDAPQTGMWTKVKAKPPGATSAVTYWILRSELASNGSRRAWTSFPLSLSTSPIGTSAYTRVINIAGLTAHFDDKKHAWYEVDAGDASMQTLSGFVCASGQANVSLNNKWAWAGFELLSSNLATADLYKRYLHLKNDNATPSEKTAFEASFNQAKSDSLISKLDEILAPDSQPKGRIAGDDLLAALNSKWRASRIDHLVVKYESEWGGQMSKWDALDPFMHDGLPYWSAEKERIKLLQMWGECTPALAPLSTPSVYHLHPVGLVGNFLDPDACACGCCMTVIGSRYSPEQNVYWYGPLKKGSIALDNCAALTTMQANGTLSETEAKILRAMSENEGKLDAVQAVDKAIISAGGMQKTIRGAESHGELATQIAVFRDMHPSEYQRYFSNCGWTVEGSGSDASLGYSHPTFTNGRRIIGDELYTALRRDCSIHTLFKPISCPPVASMAHGVSSPLYQELQVKDFVNRLNDAIGKKPTHYAYRISDYLQSPLGRATVLDQDVNAPSATASSMKASLDRFFQHNPQASHNPAEWGANRAAYETSILQDYGPSRFMAVVNGVSVAPGRYQHLVQALGMPS